MRADSAYLHDIVEAAGRIAEYIDGMTRVDFLSNNMAKAAVVREIEIMGEAASEISDAFKEKHPELRWKELAQLRNFYIHVYHRIRHEKVWSTAKRTIPAIAQAIAPLVPPVEDRK